VESADNVDERRLMIRAIEKILNNGGFVNQFVVIPYRLDVGSKEGMYRASVCLEKTLEGRYKVEVYLVCRVVSILASRFEHATRPYTEETPDEARNMRVCLGLTALWEKNEKKKQKKLDKGASSSSSCSSASSSRGPVQDTEEDYGAGMYQRGMLVKVMWYNAENGGRWGWYNATVLRVVGTGIRVKFDTDGSNILVENEEISSMLRTRR
jgi:hypothetical protein